MTVEIIDLISGIFSLIFVIITSFVGLRTIAKYFKTRQNKAILWIGCAWTLISCPWWPSAISAFVALATGTGLSFEMYVFLGTFFVPILVVFMLIALTELYFNEKRMIIISIFIIIGSLFEIYLIYHLVVDPNVLGSLKGVVDIEYKGFLRYYLIFSTLVIFISGILISLSSLKSDSQEIKLRGKLLTVAYIIFFLGAVADSSLTLDIITLPIVRLMLITSSILFYLGIILPNWMKKLFIKEGDLLKEGTKI